MNVYDFKTFTLDSISQYDRLKKMMNNVSLLNMTRLSGKESNNVEQLSN